jgi:hypothetical protein
MNDFAEAVRANTNVAYTANGALSNAETLNAVLDFFSKSGALRGHPEKEVLTYFTNAAYENERLAMKALFYSRDIRGGQGERQIFNMIVRYLADTATDIIKRNIDLVPEYGRWDDMYSFIGTKLEKDALEIMKVQFFKDLLVDKPSLLGKWLKSSNTSSDESKRLAKITYKYFGITEREYRQSLSALRKKIKIVETFMSSNQWEAIDFSAIPSQATRLYSDAFRKHDGERYNAFIEKVTSGEEKINAGTLYPYQITQSLKDMSHSDTDKIKAYDAMWNALPNYMEEPENSLCVVDTSGSMWSGHSNVAPIDVSVSLGIYFAERIIGPFKDYFMTFSENPVMQKIRGNNIYEKYTNLRSADWGMSTDIQKVFNVLLRTAKERNVSQDEMIKKIYIISDMQFNEATSGSGYHSRREGRVTNFDAIREQYEAAGYDMPELVFWNVNASGDTPVTKDENGTFLVSGCSPSILKYAVNCEAVTPEQLMLEVLESDRYKPVK